MSVVEGIRRMVAAGLSYEEAISIAAEFEVPPGTKRDARAERNRRYYESHKASGNRLNKTTETSESTSRENPVKTPKTSEKRLNSDASPRARVEDKPPLLEIEPQDSESKKEVVPSLSREPSPREILLSVLDEETADAVMKHRKGKRSPLTTGMAARGLVKAFSEYPGGAREAAEMMVTNGWTGFKREYWDKGQPRGSPRLTGVEAEREKLRQEIENEQREAEANQNSGHAFGLLEFDREGFDRSH